MPRPLTQNRNQFFAQQVLIAAQNSTQSLQARLVSQTVADASRLIQDQLTANHRQDRFVKQNQQAMDARLQTAAYTRTASNDAQADKIFLNQQDFTAYQTAQIQRQLMSTPMILGYA